MARVEWKEINRLAIPAIISGIAEPVISLVDTAVVGHLGATELGGVGVGTSLYTLLIWVLAQTKSAISAIVSQSLGQGTLHKLNKFVPQALTLNFLLGCFVLAATVPFATWIFQLYNAQGELMAAANEYYQVRALGFPLGLFVFGVFGVFRGLQNTSWAMQISFAGAALNIVLDLVLVYGIPGLIPSFGVAGAAWASVAAQSLMFVLCLVYLKNKTPFGWRLSRAIHQKIRSLLKMSGDLFIRAIALNVAFYMGTSFSTAYGEEQVAAFTIGVNIWLFSSFFIDGYSNAGMALAGKLFGAKNMEELKRVSGVLLRVNVIIAGALGLGYFALYPWMGQFFTDSKGVIELFNAVFWIIILSQPINAIAFTMDGIFKGLGRTALLRNLLIISTFLIFLPSMLALDSYLGTIHGIWLSFVLWMLARGLPLWYYLRKL